MIGGPLRVQTRGGGYYPASIHVGGTTGVAVRAIDTGVIDLFSRAEISGNGGKNDTGGGITHSSFSTVGGSSDPGSIKVTVLPAAALEANPGWRLAEVTDWQPSGNTVADLSPGNYTLNLTTVSGFKAPTPQSVSIVAGKVSKITFTSVRTASAFAVTASGKAARSYVLERQSTLGTGPWTPVDSVGPLAADGPVNLSDSSPPPGSGFYRLQVSSP